MPAVIDWDGSVPIGVSTTPRICPSGPTSTSDGSVRDRSSAPELVTISAGLKARADDGSVRMASVARASRTWAALPALHAAAKRSLAPEVGEAWRLAGASTLTGCDTTPPTWWRRESALPDNDGLTAN